MSHGGVWELSEMQLSNNCIIPVILLPILSKRYVGTCKPHHVKPQILFLMGFHAYNRHFY